MQATIVAGFVRRGTLPVAAAAIVHGLAYTVFSEWLNVEAQRNWAYRFAMLRLLGIGLTPLLQRLVVPALAFSYARRAVVSLRNHQ